MLRRSIPMSALPLLAVVVLAAVCSVPTVSAVWNIDQFGAIAGETSNDVGYTNSHAILHAMQAANASATDRTVVVPAGKVYTYFNVTMSNLFNVTLAVQGKLLVSNNITEWKGHPTTHNAGTLQFINSHFITLEGPGEIDGQGYDWWWYVILTTKDFRPHLVTMSLCTNIVIKNLLARNSMQFHFKFDDVLNVHVDQVTIHVDVDKQKEMLASRGLLKDGIPIFPLNTDGIDPAGRNVLIENSYIENFDDAVAVKPSHGNGVYATCSSNITVRNVEVAWGVGMTIGSVPPSANHACIKGVLFENIRFSHPIKAVYIKTDPGTGTGEIRDITYRNVSGDLPLWYPIWIGPQQQRQPGTAGTGCSWLFPIEKTCPTQPLVPISDITLEDVNFQGGLTLPGVMLCNATNPCTNFRFNNVLNSGEFFVNKTYWCENVQGTFVGSNPTPECFSS